MSLLVSFLIFLVILVIVGGLVWYIVSQMTSPKGPLPPFAPNVVLIICALVVLIWIIKHVGAIQGALGGHG